MANPSRKTSIEAMCKQCIYDKADDGTWRAQVEACTCDGRNGSTKCALYDVRPLPIGKKIDIKTV